MSKSTLNTNTQISTNMSHLNLDSNSSESESSVEEVNCPGAILQDDEGDDIYGAPDEHDQESSHSKILNPNGISDVNLSQDTQNINSFAVESSQDTNSSSRYAPPPERRHSEDGDVNHDTNSMSDTCDLSPSTSEFPRAAIYTVRTLNSCTVSSTHTPEEQKPIPEFLNYPTDNICGDKRTKMQNEWMSNKTFDDVKLTDDGNDILSIGGLMKKNITISMLKILCKPYNFGSATKRVKADLVSAIVSTIKSGNAMSLMKTKLSANLDSSSKNAVNKKTKPGCVKKDGTLYRIINVITSPQGKPHFMNLFQNFDRQDIDSNLGPHYGEYQHLLLLYNDVKNEDYNQLHSCVRSWESSMVNRTFKISDCQPNDYDALTVPDMKGVLKYIGSQYQAASGRQAKSGTHDNDFINFVNGKLWLLYLHELLEAICDKNLFACCFAQLDEDTFLSSSQMANSDDNFLNNINRKRKQNSSVSNSKEENEMKKLKKDIDIIKVKSMSAFEEKTKTFEKISINRRLSEVYELMSSYLPEINDLRSQLDELKAQRDNESTNYDQLKRKHSSTKSIYKLKKKMYKNLEKETEDLEEKLSKMSDNKTSEILNDNDDDSSTSSW